MKKWLLTAACGLLCSTAALADGWGGVSGQVVINGAVPEPVLLHKKGAPVKDAEVCAVADTYSEDVVADKDSKGLANVFIYLSKAPKAIHPDLKAPTEKSVLMDQKACAFLPHAMIVRAGQSVEVISSDAVAHNTHTFPIKNQGQNLVVAPNTPKGSGVMIDCKVGERLPIQVKCDYHPWMLGYWLIVDHPYAAVTDKEGKFKIENLPVGEHECVIWHETALYIDRKFKITVKDGEVAELKPITVDAAKLKKK